nr:MAG TPA: virion morphogenesis protein [Caudoviricetes sp.]
MAVVDVKIELKDVEVLEKLKRATAQNYEALIGIIDNPEIAKYAAYNEFGWVQTVTPKQSAYLSGLLGYNTKVNGFGEAPVKPGSTLLNPPRPFLRATAKEKQSEWTNTLAKLIKGKTGVLNVAQAVEMMARQAQVDVQTTIKNNGTEKEKFPDRSPLTLKLYDAKDRTTAKGRKRKIESDSGSGRKQALFKTGKMLGAIGYEVKVKS